MRANWISGQRIDVPCTIEVEHTSESLHAHVELLSDIVIEPGDEVIVHGDRVDVRFGEKAVLRRRATIVRAGQLERLWTKLISKLELTELYEVSFSSRSRL